MENNLTQSIKNKYALAIKKFENFLKNLQDKYYKGYIINIKDLNKIKKEIDYDNIKENIKIKSQNDLEIKNSEKIFKINDIEFRTSNYLINMIYNGNEYIMITEELWKSLCNEGEEKKSPISYKIKSNNLYINFENDKKLMFNQFGVKKNNIDKSTYDLSSKSNLIHLKEIYNDITKYYDFEQKFLSNLKVDKNAIKMDYLINKKWFDKWKKYSNYEEIKNKFLTKNNNNEFEIMNKIIFFHEKNKYFRKL